MIILFSISKKNYQKLLDDELSTGWVRWVRIGLGYLQKKAKGSNTATLVSKTMARNFVDGDIYNLIKVDRDRKRNCINLITILNIINC